MIAKPPRPLFNVSASFKHKIPIIMEVTGSNKHMKLALVLPNNRTPSCSNTVAKKDEDNANTNSRPYAITSILNTTSCTNRFIVKISIVVNSAK